ncbi:hypothetical protein KJ865_08735, partial [Myxococcota bacterium]|nr:hypothetical protein [Myxococcota bacterium]
KVLMGMGMFLATMLHLASAYWAMFFWSTGPSQEIGFFQVIPEVNIAFEHHRKEFTIIKERMALGQV